MKKRFNIVSFILFICGILIFTACRNSGETQATPRATIIGAQSTPTQASGSNAYPASPSEAAYPGSNLAGQTSLYPGISGEEVFTTPPDPSRELPAAESGFGVIGGVLIREVTADGFVPFDPYELILAEIINNVEGQPAFISYNEQSKRAETFPTGIFIFQEVPPGTYALVVNMAVAEFPVRDDSGEQVFVTVEAGQVMDMGQIIIQMP